MQTNDRRLDLIRSALETANTAEKLTIAEEILADVVERLGPVMDPVMCVAQGMLSTAKSAVDQAATFVRDTGPDEDFPEVDE